MDQRRSISVQETKDMNRGGDKPRRLSVVSGLMGMFLAVAMIGFIAISSSSASPDDREGDNGNMAGNGKARNVILLIGDGMGDSEITIARNYQVGAAGRLALDTLPMTGAYTTYSVQEANPKLPDYVTDSAASGTGWATGSKTSNGRISTTAATDKDLQTILELAQKKSMGTGNVSTADITDATPAVQNAHVSSRKCQGPQDMANCSQDKKSAGGPGSIAEQSVDHKVDVLLGGGKARYDQVIDGGPYTGKTVTQMAQDQGYNVVTDAAGMQAARPGQKLLGLFNPGNMSLEWKGELAAPEPGTGPQRCVENQRPANEPSLEAMTGKAIQLLEQKKGREGKSGFFLQVEGASVDKQDHAANPCGQIGENIAFDKAVKMALDYAKKDRNTLVVVTADHAHTSQIIPTYAKSPGKVSTLITADGAPMKVNYATGVGGQQHTGSQVRIAAQGPQSQRVLGVTDQTDLFRTMAIALGVNKQTQEPDKKERD